MKIVTCHHVVSPPGTNVTKVEVLFGGRPYEVPVVAIRNIPSADLAVLDATGTNVPQLNGLTLGKFSDAEEGDDILVVGFPLGEPIITIHKGIVSSKGRFRFEEPSVTVDCLKLDASINVGNSGGPCWSLEEGKVVGIISARAPVSASLSYQIGEQIRQAKLALSQRPGRVEIMGVDPIELSINVADVLYRAVEETRQLGIGYAISIEYVKGHL